MWRIIDLLAYLLFGAKNFKFTPLPDNCPPDGSMLFMSCPPPAYGSMPTGFLYYEFGPSCDESDPVAIALSKQIIEVLCQSRKVLTVVKAHREFDGKGREVPPLFIHHYSGMLQSECPEISVYQEGGTRLAYLATDYDKDLLPAYYTVPTGTMCDFSFYLFPRSEPLADARQALEKATANQYALKLDFIDHGPISLEVCVNPESGNADYVRSVVEQVCDENDIRLIKD